MKQKLKAVFVLIAAALAGIIIFQAYWTINAYKVNKEKFDIKVNQAMQSAMDDCKKDYFDSIRRVLVRRLSPPETFIEVDTLHEKDTVNVMLKIILGNKYTSMTSPFTVTTPELDFYRKKISHKSTLPEVLAEMSFYSPSLMNDFTVVLGMYDIMGHSTELNEFNKKHPDAPIDSTIKFDQSLQNSIYKFPPNFRAADSLKLTNYLQAELKKINIGSGFDLFISTKSVAASKPNSHYSETGEYSYKYHGFKVFHIVGPEFFIHATFRNPQYAVIKGMLSVLALSILLVVFIVFCFYYIIRTFIEQKKLADLKDDFINNMTHELKTPIATITVAIEGLQKFNVLNDEDKTQRYLATSKKELSRLNELVTKVLDIAAFENKEIGLTKEQVNISGLINEVIQSEKQKSSGDINITFDDQSATEFIYADRLHLRNVLSNLIDNAIKYSPVPAEVAIDSRRSAGHIEISIKDHGIGIPAAHITLIFDKFHRVPTGNIHSVKGTGLGLSYVRYIVEAHGGSVNVKSEINKGSEFIVSLPLKNE